MDISDRKRLILAAVVSLYAESGDPIGSNILNRFLDQVSVSSATLRNEMAELTLLGLLEQPHTSAGRVPTSLGMRYYVDHLMRLFPLTVRERHSIDRVVSGMDTDPDKAVESAVKALSEWFELAAMAVTPVGPNPHFVHFEMMRVGRFHLAVMGVTDTGSVKSRVCRVEDAFHESALLLVKTALNDHLVFVSSEDAGADLIARIGGALGENGVRLMPVILSAVALVRQAADVRVYADGEYNLLRYREMASGMRAYLELLNDTDRVSALLGARGEVVRVLLGEEIDPEIRNMGMVVSGYRAGGLSGGVGVTGPGRMNYAYIIPRLKYFCDSLSVSLNE